MLVIFLYFNLKCGIWVISILTNLLNTSQDEYVRFTAAESLGKIDPEDPSVKNVLLTLFCNSQDQQIRLLSADSLVLVEPGNLEAMNFLTQQIYTTSDEHVRCLAAESLGKHDPENNLCIATLIKLLINGENIAWRLIEILPKKFLSKVVSDLKDCLDNQLYEDFNLNSWDEIFGDDSYDILEVSESYNFELNQRNCYEGCYEVLWHCAQSMSYLNFYQAWHCKFKQC